MSLRSFCAFTTSLAFVAACGGSALPPPQAVEAKSSISAAEAVGAQNEPKAALHLKLAKDQTAQAETLLRNGDDDEARLLLEQAKVDAELALVLTREASMRAQVQQSLSKVRDLEQSND
ncbi:MAG TPA: DUF4398 domain-containing protein [Polyangiaceae bacterium]|nr:DUF4398 domain-containing protein [Polyangiaceae bacterium]